MMKRVPWLVPAGLLMLALLPGCTEPVRTYEVSVTKQRLLGALIQTPKGLWVFKLIGHADDVAAQKEAFQQFVRSVRFPAEGNDAIKWRVPVGWEHEPGKGMRYATFRLPQNLEVSVFSNQGGDLLQNVNRWRDQLKLEPIRRRQLSEIGKKEKLDGVAEVFIVDMESARFVPLREPVASGKPVDYKVPDGWVESAETGQFAVASFTIEEGGKRANVKITPLVGGGSPADNINRWRQQVGLPKVEIEQVIKELDVIEVDDQDAFFVTLVGPEGMSIHAVICPRSKVTWFVKMLGDSDLVGKQKKVFETFLSTLTFRGG